MLVVIKRLAREQRRGLVWGVVGLAALVLAGVWAARNARLEDATIGLLNDAQTAWYAQPVLSYRMEVDVNRPGEFRRVNLTVRDGEVVEALVKYRSPNTFLWEDPYPLNADQAEPFTIPGLYDMVRGAINAGNRTDIRVDMGWEDGPVPFPRRVVLGSVWDGGLQVSGTEAQVVVRRFEVLE